MRFQKRIKLMPGVRLNLSMSGASVSLGAPGATVNIGKKGMTGTMGLPGSGLSWSKQVGWQQSKSLSAPDEIAALIAAANALEAPLRKIPGQVNASVARADKAMDAFLGGRGATESKLGTLTTRINTELDKVEQAQDELDEAIAFFTAVEQRLLAMTFGFFGGGQKKRRDAVVESVRQAKASVQRARDQVAAEADKMRQRIEDGIEQLYGQEPDQA